MTSRDSTNYPIESTGQVAGMTEKIPMDLLAQGVENQWHPGPLGRQIEKASRI